MGRAVTVIAEVPPPVRGDTAITKLVIDQLQGCAERVRVLDLSSGRPEVDAQHKLVKMLRVFVTSLQLLLSPKKPNEILYTVANSGLGLYWNMLALVVAIVRGYDCYLHHHAYLYIHKYDWRMKVVDGLVRRAGKHIFQCDCMVADFETRYGAGTPHIIVPETVILLSYQSCDSVPVGNRAEVRLGMLSNLTVEKGLDLAIETFERLHGKGVSTSLLLAGPAKGETEERLIDDAVKKYGSHIRYLGPVYGEAKRSFFEEVDVFLLPTKYLIEVQPLVIAEAMAHGVPTIAFGRACIPELMDESGMIVPVGADFVTAATEQLTSWSSAKGNLDNAKSDALRRSQEILRYATTQMDEFLAEVSS